MIKAQNAAEGFGAIFASLNWAQIADGFSGAVVFAGTLPESKNPAFCLKGWPQGSMTLDRLTWVHKHVVQVAHLPFVPSLVVTSSGQSGVEQGGGVWELSTWKPGLADYRSQPSAERLANACRAIAALHQTWRAQETSLAPFPAIARRLTLLREWKTRAADTRDPPQSGNPNLQQVLARAWTVLPRWVDRVVNELAPLANRLVAVHPCLCDIHHDHVLFSGDTVTGVIDFGAMKWDHPAVDLARLLGDFLGDDHDKLHFGLAEYHAAGGSPDVDAPLVSRLDRTGIVCSVTNWLLRLSGADPLAVDHEAVAGRLDRLVRRLERDFAP